MVNPLDPEQQRAWSLALLETYQQIREAHPELQGLRAPQLVIDPDLQARHGHWDEDNRVIALAAKVLYCNWDDVLLVLKHEMAHQIVSELFEIRAAKPHGEAFVRACRILNIPPAATAELTEAPEGLSEPAVVRRIRKLMALGQSPNHHEAERALVKAQELALKHNVSALEAQQAQRYGVRVVGKVYRRVPGYVWAVANIVGDFYFVLYICRWMLDEEGENAKFFELYGTRENLDMAEYVFHFLLRQGQAEWQKYKEARGLNDSRRRQSFLRGVYAGFRDKLSRQRSELAERSALVWLGDPKLDAFYRRRNPRTRSVRSSYRDFRDAHEAGHEVGQRLRIRHGVNAGHPGPRKHLKS